MKRLGIALIVLAALFAGGALFYAAQVATLYEGTTAGLDMGVIFEFALISILCAQLAGALTVSGFLALIAARKPLG